MHSDKALGTCAREEKRQEGEGFGVEAWMAGTTSGRGLWGRGLHQGCALGVAGMRDVFSLQEHKVGRVLSC